MNRLSFALGLPQNRFTPIHVVGTNGKSSVTRMIAALLEAHGVPTGASLSPHLHRWAERVRIRGAMIEPEAFARAVGETARAAEGVNRALEEGEELTQFEIATAASFVALAEARVKVGVIEAGLGGRLDATNTIPSVITVLTSVGLDHTEWLGETELEIATEKLAVLRDQSTLVVGRLSPEVLELARAEASCHGARLIEAPSDPGVELGATGGFQRQNFATALAAAEAFAGELRPELVEAVAASTVIPGRLQLAAEDPPTYVDVAHNPQGAAALAASLPEVSAGRPVVALMAVLADKDVEGMLAALAPALELMVATELPEGSLRGWGRPGARSVPAARLADLAREAGVPASVVAEPADALLEARREARTRGGVALATGSHYLLGALSRP